jgi:hypothetical protein
MQNLRANFLILIRSVVGVNDWVFEDGIYISVTPDKKDEMNLRMHNIQLFFQWLKKQCAFDEKVDIVEFTRTPAEVGCNWSLRLLHSTLCLAKIERLDTDADFVTFTRRTANYVRTLTEPLVSLDALEEIISKAEEAKRTQDQERAAALAAQKPKQDAPKTAAAVKKAEMPRYQEVGAENNRKQQSATKNKSRGKNPAQSRNTSSGNSKPSKAQSQAPLKVNKAAPRYEPGVPPQKPPKGRLPRPAPGVILSGGTVNVVSEVSYESAPPVGQALLPHRAADPIPNFLPTARLFSDQEVLITLDQFMAKMAILVKAKNQGPYKLSTCVAAWHYLHGQIGNMLSLLDRQHLALTLFKAPAYNGRLLYDVQKHQYFPTLPFSAAADIPCFHDVAALQGALSFMMAGCYSDDACQANTEELVKGWANYVLTEFNNNNLMTIISNFTANEFGLWIQKKIKHYTLEIKTLLASNSEDNINQYAIRFYLTRIGELVGHLPFKARTPYLKFCRDFRNDAAHTFESGLDEPNLNLQKLLELVPAEPSQRFFGKKTELCSDWQFFVNNRFCYQQYSDEMPLVQLLVELRVRDLRARLAAPFPVEVCSPVNLTKLSNFYAIIKPTFDKIQHCQEGMILMPVNFTLKSSEVNPLGIALYFKRVEGVCELVDISYSCVTDKSEGIAECMDSLRGNWLAAHSQTQKPVCTEVPLRSISVDQDHHHGVLQVELLARLAERSLLGAIAPFSTGPDEALMLRLRQEHLHLLWPTHKGCYFQQMLENGVRRQDRLVEVVSAVSSKLGIGKIV